MSSRCRIIAENLSSLRSKMASVLSEYPSGLYRDIYFELTNQIDEILCSFTFLLPLSDCSHQWIETESWRSYLPIDTEATIETVVKELKPEDADNVWHDMCEMMKKKDYETIPERALELLEVLSKLNKEIDFLKQRMGSSVSWVLTQCSLRDICDWKDVELLVSSVFSCLSKIEERWKLGYFRHDLSKVLNLHKNLRDMQIFRRGLPDIKEVEDLTIHIGGVAVCVLIGSCGCWASKFESFIDLTYFDYDGVLGERQLGLPDPEQMIRAINSGIPNLMLRILKTLKATDRSLFDEKVTVFGQYVLNRWMRHVVLNKDKELLIISIDTWELNITKYDRSLTEELGSFQKLIFEIENFLPSCWVLSLLAYVWLVQGEYLIIRHLRYRRPLSKKCELQKIRISPPEHTENVNQTLRFVEEVAQQLQKLPSETYFYGSIVCLILIEIQCFRLERKLDHYNGSSKVSITDKVQSFQEWLKFLINCFLSKPGNGRGLYEKSIDFCKARIEAREGTVAFFCQNFFLTYNITEEMIPNLNLMLSDMLDDIIMPVIEQFRQIGLPVTTSCPKINGLGFYDYLLSKFEEFINHETILYLSSQRHLKEIRAHLLFFRDFLGNNPGYEAENDKLGDLFGLVIRVAYEAENLFESIMESKKHEWHFSVWLYDFLRRIRHAKMLVIKSQEKKANDIKVENVPQTSRHVVSRASTSRIDEVVLSINDQQTKIIDQLVGGHPQQDIVSIIGMAGIGKTTLAKNVYGSPTVVHHFHIRAWCFVTEVYRKQELLLEILSQIIEVTDKIRGMSGEDLEFKLRQLLLKHRYLIVMDDLWRTEAWDDLRMTFPDDGNGSRILITSRLNDVASKAKAHSDAIHLRLLSDAESWDLLQMKIFNKELCPKELVEVGQEIAKSCKGLPLAIAAMAGILIRTDRTGNCWKEIAKNLRSQIIDDAQVQCRDILELSYKHLPDCLKACFVYFGAFLEDQEIPVKKLQRLWIAEGFLQKNQLKSMEDLAEDWLNDLIGRSLVIFVQPRSQGGAKTCRVHDLLRDFCQSKAKEDGFLQVITTPNKPDVAFDDLDFLASVNFKNSPSHKTYEDHRLCFYSKRNHFIQSRPSGTLVRSLLFFATNDKYARCSYDISFISHNFKRLRVLDLECINMGPSFPTEIEQMMWLRYLALCGDVESIPSSISKLSYLETFVLKGLKGKVDLPETMWCLKRLRHFHVTDVAIMNLEIASLCSPGSEDSPLLDCLVTLSWLFLPNGDTTNYVLKMFRSLRKLGCIFSESPDYYGSDNLFPRLDILSNLESLKISYYGRALPAAEFSFPLSLKKLTLSNFRLPWSHISVIGRLQNLEALKLLSRAYDGEIWDMVEGEFCNLKFLKLDNINVAKWNVSNENLPKLEKLVLRNCKHLEEVPSSFVEISTLKIIEVKWCGKSAEESVRRMRDDADEYLNIIIASDFDFRVSL